MENSNMVSTSPPNTQELSQDKCSRLHRYFRFLRVSIFIMVLIMIHAWLENSLGAILITYLTGDVLQLPKAASIVNVQDGISAFLLLLVAWLSNKPKIGSFKIIVITTIFNLIGLVLLYIVAKEKNPKMSFLFIAVIFTALGRSGHDISLKQFLADQCKAEWSLDDDDEEKIESLRQIHWRIASVSGVIVSICVSWFYSYDDLAQVSKISAIAMVVGFGFFVAGTPFYHDFKLRDGDGESAMSRLLLAAVRKKHLPHTSSSAAASENRHVYMDMTLRWVNKATIIEPSLSIEEQQRRGRLYTIERVRDVKNMLSLIPLWTTFLVYGLLEATSSFFVYEQVSYMDPKLGLITNVPVVIFTVIMSSTAFVVSYICEKLFPSYSKDGIPRRYVMLIRIGVGLAITPVCCVIAWRVESHRLEKHVKSDVEIGIVWLIPQFFLLGVSNGLVLDGMENFFNANVSTPLRKYGPSFTEFAPNIGHFISLALVLNLRSLFGDDLNMSSLGLYYAILSYVCLVNLMFYCFVATHYVKRQEGENYPQDEEAGNREQNGESYDQVEEREGQEMEEVQNGEAINPDDAGNYEQGELYVHDEERDGQEDGKRDGQEMDGHRNATDINSDDADNHKQEGELYVQGEERKGEGMEDMQNGANINPDADKREQEGELYVEDEEREGQGMEEHQNATYNNPDDQVEEREGQEMEEVQNGEAINPDDAGNYEEEGESYVHDEERDGQEDEKREGQEMEEQWLLTAGYENLRGLTETEPS